MYVLHRTTSQGKDLLSVLYESWNLSEEDWTKSTLYLSIKNKENTPGAEPVAG